MSSKIAVAVRMVLGIAFAAIGSFVALIFLTTFIFGWSTDDPWGTKIALEIIFLLFIACAGLVVFTGIRIIARVGRFYTYRAYLVNKDSVRLEVLSQRIGKNIAYVIKDLEKMISKGFFVNVYLDTDEGVLAIAGSRRGRTSAQNIATETVECESCGARNVRPVGGTAYCEYCKGPLK